MKTFARNALALILGIAIGGGVNMALVLLGPKLIAPPPGADMSTAAGLAAAMPMLEPKHFLMPFWRMRLGLSRERWWVRCSRCHIAGSSPT